MFLKKSCCPNCTTLGFNIVTKGRGGQLVILSGVTIESHSCQALFAPGYVTERWRIYLPREAYVLCWVRIS